LRQAYDYWQDQPGSCHTSRAAGCSLSKATDTGERNPAAGAARLDVRCIGMNKRYPSACGAVRAPPGSDTARTAFRLCSTEHPTQTPSTLRNAGTSRERGVREFPSAALLRWQPTAPNKLASVRSSCSGGAGVPAGLPLVFNQACTSCIGTSSQHLGRGLLCWRAAGPDGRRIFRKRIRKAPAAKH